jgi:hypothetical protein
VRGLAHPVLFQQSQRTNTETMGELLAKFGAVPVSPMTYFQVTNWLSYQLLHTYSHCIHIYLVIKEQ